MSKWNTHSACAVIRHLAGLQVPYLALRQVVAGLGLKASDNTFKIQMAAGRKALQTLPMSELEQAKLQGLLAQYGPSTGVETPDRPGKPERVRLRLLEDTPEEPVEYPEVIKSAARRFKLPKAQIVTIRKARGVWTLRDTYRSFRFPPDVIRAIWAYGETLSKELDDETWGEVYLTHVHNNGLPDELTPLQEQVFREGYERSYKRALWACRLEAVRRLRMQMDMDPDDRPVKRVYLKE